MIDWPPCLRCVKVALYRTEFAAKMAAAPRLDQRHRDVSFTLEDTAIDARQAQVRSDVLSVECLQGIVPDVVNNVFPLPLGFANDDCISVHRGFFRAQRGMESAQHDLDAPLTVFRCDLVSAPCRVGFDADCDDVGRFVKRNGFQPVVIKAYVHVVGCQSRNSGRRQRFHLPAAYVFLVACPASDTRVNERQAQAFLRAAHRISCRRNGADSGCTICQSQV